MLRRIFPAIVFLLFFGGIAHAETKECVFNNEKAATSELRRGVNLTNWWENDRSQALNDDDIKKLRAFGFDFVRLPMATKWLTIKDENEQKEKIRQLRCDLISLLNRNLRVVLDLHAPGVYQDYVVEHPDQALSMLTDVWALFGPVIKDLPADRVLFGLYNEPQIGNDAWWDIQGRLIAKLRPAFPHTTFVVSAGEHGEPWKLADKKPYDDKNIVYDFHFYQPMFFTHHGARWFPADDPIRISREIDYPADPAEAKDESNPDVKEYLEKGWNKDALEKFIEGIATWARNNDAKIACLEFGVYKPYTDSKSRANWLRDMRELLEEYDIPWALWEYRGGFGLLNDGWVPEEGMVKALGLNEKSAP